MNYPNLDPEMKKQIEANKRKARDERLEEVAGDFLKMRNLFDELGFEGQYHYGVIAELVKTAELKKITAAINSLDFNL